MQAAPVDSMKERAFLTEPASLLSFFQIFRSEQVK